MATKSATSERGGSPLSPSVNDTYATQAGVISSETGRLLQREEEEQSETISWRMSGSRTQRCRTDALRLPLTSNGSAAFTPPHSILCSPFPHLHHLHTHHVIICPVFCRPPVSEPFRGFITSSAHSGPYWIV